METEKIWICDEEGRPQGIAARQDVHAIGHWHETFHCWLVGRQGNKDMIYLQLRSEDKKDFPGLFDITAAGHLLADETVEDGIREIQEELGLGVEFEELTFLGTIKDQMALPGFIDNERCHCFLYRVPENIDLRFELQLAEVAGMAKLDFEALAALFAGKIEKAVIEGFMGTPDGSSDFNKTITRKDIVPHSPAYLEKVIQLIRKKLNN